MVDFLELAERRRSIRDFSPKPLAWGDIIELIRAASYAPSAGDLQPWRFIVVTDKDARASLVQACPQQGWMANAPVLLAVVTNEAQAEEYYGDRGKEWSAQSAGAAIQNILLAVDERGLGACWVGSFDPSNVRDILRIPDGFHPHALIAIGQAEEIPEPKKVKPLDSIVYFNEFGARQESMAASLRDYGEIVQKKREQAREGVRRKVSETQERFHVRQRVEGIGGSVWDGIRDFFRRPR